MGHDGIVQHLSPVRPGQERRHDVGQKHEQDVSHYPLDHFVAAPDQERGHGHGERPYKPLIGQPCQQPDSCASALQIGSQRDEVNRKNEQKRQKRPGRP